ncbi:MAG: DUF975 family protein [Lachnospiraceae bacterium]|nr:DUF975 family protein [Lachnospiraceae bacterium]
MNQYKSSAELKDLAKEKLIGRYGITMSAFILVSCITYLITFLVTGSMPTQTTTQYVIYSLVTGIISVFLGVFQTGTSLFYLNIACGQPYRLEDIFYGISNQPSRSITVSLANTLANWVCLTPTQIFLLLFMNSESITYLMLMFVATGVGLLIYVPVSLAISQSFYILLDFPEYTGKQALAASWKLMKGHKGRLFYIQVSFLPLMILSFLSCGLGFLWLTPYMNMTYTLFFLDIMNPAKATVEI